MTLRNASYGRPEKLGPVVTSDARTLSAQLLRVPGTPSRQCINIGCDSCLVGPRLGRQLRDRPRMPPSACVRQRKPYAATPQTGTSRTTCLRMSLRRSCRRTAFERPPRLVAQNFAAYSPEPAAAARSGPDMAGQTTPSAGARLRRRAR
jgi:hypothetical protein